MDFIVKFRRGGSAKSQRFPQAVLTQNDWDDYGYKTTFDATLRKSRTQTIDLGDVKILHENQTRGYTPMPREPFGELTDAHCSIGGSLSYYETLFRLGKEIYHPYLLGVRDVVYDKTRRKKFEKLEGFRVSLLRFSGAEQTISDATQIFERHDATRSRTSAALKVKFQTLLGPGAAPLEMNFAFGARDDLPSRINAIVGANGSGKTKLLSNLAMVVSSFGLAQKQDLLQKRAGRFIGDPPPFKKVIVVSYSPFDVFVIPGRTRSEQERLRTSGEIFGYVYCGLRERTSNALVRETDPAAYRLKSPVQLEREFSAALKRVARTKRTSNLLQCLRPLLRDTSFQRVSVSNLLVAGKELESLESAFKGFSSGQKIVLKIISELVAHFDQSQTLVLIDEPETHLHPPLLAALLTSVRDCLNQFDGFAIVATHSPVVLQETPARYVHVLRRTENQSNVSATGIETFGENIGVITQDVFGLDDVATDWHEVLRELAKELTLEDIEEIFGRRLGFGARSYVASLRNTAN